MKPWERYKELKPLTEEQKAKLSGDYSKGVPLAFLTGLGEGVLSGLESYANGYTLGGYDWLNRQFGRNPQDLRDKLQQRAESVDLGGLNTAGQVASGLGGALRGLPKLTGAAGEKLLGSRAWGLPAMGLSGSLDSLIQSSFDNDFSNPMQTAIDTAQGGAIGIGMGGVGNVALKPMAKYLSSNAMTKGLKGGLDNVADNPQALRLVNDAVRRNNDIAELYLEATPSALNKVNADTSTLINKALTRKINVPKTIGSQKRKYGKFMEEHGQDQLLNPKSAKQQAKENFNKWFKGSQIVDESGNPIPYYHGSLRKFNEFKQHNGDYNFSPDKEFAYNYAETKGFEQGIDNEPQLYSVFLNSKRPFDINNVDDLNNLSNYIKGKKIRVFGNEKSFDDFIEQAQGKYYDTPLRKGEFEKLDDPFFNKWYSHLNEKLDYEPSSVTEHKILDINKPEEYFIAGQPQWGLSINDVEEQVKNQLKDVKWLNNKARVYVDVDTPYGKRVNYVDLIKVHKPSPKNLKEGAENWITLESADFDGEDFGDALKKMGYDGYYKTEKGVKNLSVFSPNQIKSVKNSGGWSKSPSLTDPDWVAEPSVADLFDGLNGFQKKSLASAIKQGSERTNSKLGSLESLNEAKKKLNDMITQAYKDGNKSDVLHLEGIKNRLDNTLGKGLKGRDRPYAKALQMEEAYNKGWEYNPNNVKLKEYTDNLNPLERNAFAQGLFGRMTYNPLMSKNLAKKAMDYDNTLQTVLPKKTYGELQKGLSKQNTRFERLSRLGKRAETRLQTPEGSRLFLREQLEETTPKVLGMPALGALLDEAIYRGHQVAAKNAAKKLLDPTFEGVKDAWLIENYPTLNAYISGALANE